MRSETYFALREGWLNQRLNEYFSARPHLDRALSLRMFEEGFKRGFDAGFENSASQPEETISSKRVYLVATGETCNGLETYTRHEALVPMADQEVLWTAEPMAQLFANFAAADLPTWSRTMLEQFVGRAHEELVKLFTWTSELYENPLTDDTMRAIRTRALDEFGTGQAQGELWEQILMRETARTIQAAAKGGL